MRVFCTHIARSGFEEHSFVEAAPNILRRVDEVLNAARNGVGSGSRLGGMEFGLCVGLGERERVDAAVDGGDVAGDAVAGGLHADDGVGGVDQVAVPCSYQLPELLLLVLDLLPRRRLRLSDLGDWLRAEERLRVAAPERGDTVLVGVRRRRRRGG